MLNSLIQATRPAVTDLIENMRSKSYFVDDSFQRRLVWTERQKIRLVQTVLMGYPMPEIYLWQQAADPETGKQQHSVVDGQQRLTTLMQFTANEWQLNAKHLDPIAGFESYRDKFWKDLPPDLKQSFWQYIVNVRTIPVSASYNDIVAVFRRLNETDKSLNPQELRNAEFNGAFIKAAENVTRIPEFKKIIAFPDTQIRRMADIEFASSLLIFLRRGLVEESLKTINETYDLYNDEYLEEAEDYQEVSNFFIRCKNEYLTKRETRKFFTRPIHLFSLFIVDQFVTRDGMRAEEMKSILDSFVEEYHSEPKHDSLNGVISAYREGSSSRTKSRSSRNNRVQSLLRYISIKRMA